MIKLYSEFIRESSSDLNLKYYCFDWDDNLLHMSTVIHMDKLVNGNWVPYDVSTSEFSEVRNDKENFRLANNDPELAYSEFRDNGKRGSNAFIEDTKDALEKKNYGPVWETFKKCLSEGALFAIITARGHEPNTIRTAVEYIIDNELSEEEKFLLYSNCLKHSYLFSTDKHFDRIPKGVLTKTPLITIYLDDCDFYGVSADSFKEKFNGVGDASNPEKAKEMALDKFIDKSNELGKKVGAKSVAIGFSDDDHRNVEHVRIFFKEKSALSNNLMDHHVKLSLFKTTDRTVKGGEKTRFYEASGSSIAPGMGSSVMAFSQFNNMADRCFTNGLEYDKSIRLGTGQLAKMSKEIVKPKKKKKKKKIDQVGIDPMDDKFFVMKKRNFKK